MGYYGIHVQYAAGTTTVLVGIPYKLARVTLLHVSCDHGESPHDVTKGILSITGTSTTSSTTRSISIH